MQNVISLVTYKGMGQPLPAPDNWAMPLNAYNLWLRAANRPASTRKLRLYHLRRFANSVKKAPFDVTTDDLLGYIGAHGWAANTRRSNRSSLMSFYHWAHHTGRAASNPAALMPVVTAPIGKPRPAAESAVLVGLSARERRIRLMVMLGAQAGLRCCEIAVVHLSDLVEDMLGHSLIVHGKGNKTRLVPLNVALAHMVREVAEEEGGYCFPGQIDGHLSAGYVSKLVSSVLPDGVTAHTLRHRFAGRAYIGSGNDLRAVQELLGHASVATTQIYTPVPDGNLRRGIDAAA
jgi:site-specific recombinase XerD